MIPFSVTAIIRKFHSSLKRIVTIINESILVANQGLGKDIWTLPFENITRILYVSRCFLLNDLLSKVIQVFYFSEVLYLGSQMMIRVSILCLYLRTFTHGTLRTMTYVLTAANVLYGTAFITASIFQCIPIDAAWTRWDGTVSAKCINGNAVGWASAAINIFLDGSTVILPLPKLARLVMSWEQKIHVVIMFGLGIL